MALTTKQEAFAQAVGFRNLSNAAAYSEVYDVSKMLASTISTKASELVKHGEVAARIKVLKARATDAAVKKAGTTLADVLAKTETAIENAQANGQVAAEVAAIKLQAQLSGHLAEKKADSKSALDDVGIDRLIQIRDEIDTRLRAAKDALEMCGGLDLPAVAPVPMRRVIG